MREALVWQAGYGIRSPGHIPKVLEQRGALTSGTIRHLGVSIRTTQRILMALSGLLS